jgi:ssDNA thymidine ADP-ribosyltransferase, DarT
VPAPQQPKIFHIVHLDRLQSIASDGELLCDALVVKKAPNKGTTIGMSGIKQRRLALPIPC